MSKTIFDVDDICAVRDALTKEYAAMPTDRAEALRDERVGEELRKIAAFSAMLKSIDQCPNEVLYR